MALGKNNNNLIMFQCPHFLGFLMSLNQKSTPQFFFNVQAISLETKRSSTKCC